MEYLSSRHRTGAFLFDKVFFLCDAEFSSTNVASIQLYSVNGAYLDITFKNDKAKRYVIFFFFSPHD